MKTSAKVLLLFSGLALSGSAAFAGRLLVSRHTAAGTETIVDRATGRDVLIQAVFVQYGVYGGFAFQCPNGDSGTHVGVVVQGPTGTEFVNCGAD